MEQKSLASLQERARSNFLFRVSLTFIPRKKQMERDLTLRTYRKLLDSYLETEHHPIALEDYFLGDFRSDRPLLLRHDVDRDPERSLDMARIEHEIGVRGTYYFRTIPGVFNPSIIRSIGELGHEIGYHYEDLARCKGDMQKAIREFRKNLEALRAYVPVRTVCMHGSPLSKHDNRKIFEHLNPEEEGILGEPYLHIEPGSFFYLSDTGGRWDGGASSVRDSSEGDRYGIRTSFELMEALHAGRLPSHIHQTVHPQRWIDARIPWIREQGLQTIKNGIKRILKRSR
jgi:hypothetical protein